MSKNKNIYLSDEVFVNSEFEMFNSLENVYIYKGNDLYIYNKISNKFDIKYSNSNDICTSSYNVNEYLVFKKISDEILITKNNIIVGSFCFNKNISLFCRDKIICTAGPSLSKRNKIEIFELSNLEDEFGLYSLPEGFNIYLKLNSIGNILFFISYDSNNRYQLLTGLDIETGMLIWQNMYEVTSEHKFIQATAYNERDQLYYGIYNTYQVFNPKTGELVLEKEIPEIAEYKLEPYINAIYDEKLWFVSGRGLNTKFGYINTETQQVELLQDFPQEEDEFFDTPVYHEGKLYLRGKHFNNLYVFE